MGRPGGEKSDCCFVTGRKGGKLEEVNRGHAGREGGEGGECGKSTIRTIITTLSLYSPAEEAE